MSCILISPRLDSTRFALLQLLCSAVLFARPDNKRHTVPDNNHQRSRDRPATTDFSRIVNLSYCYSTRLYCKLYYYHINHFSVCLRRRLVLEPAARARSRIISIEYEYEIAIDRIGSDPGRRAFESSRVESRRVESRGALWLSLNAIRRALPLFTRAERSFLRSPQELHSNGQKLSTSQVPI